MGRAQVHTVSNLTMSRSAGIRFICRCGILTTLWRLRAHAHAPAPARRSDSITPAQWERPSAPLERAVTTQARARCCWLGTPSDGRSSQLLYSAQLARPAAADRARPRATAATHDDTCRAASRMPGSREPAHCLRCHTRITTTRTSPVPVVPGTSTRNADDRG